MKRALLALLVWSFPLVPHALAVPLHWTLSGVAFSSGGAVLGTFDFDANSGTYSNVDITTTADSSFGGATCTLVNPFIATGNSSFSVLTGPGSTTLLDLEFLDPLTNAGGSVPVHLAVEGTCSALGCGITGSFLRFSPVDTGVVTAANIPEPSCRSSPGSNLQWHRI
jgi:hypothetical protein